MKLSQTFGSPKNQGFLILEALISVTIIAIVAVNVFPLVNFMIRRSTRIKDDAVADSLLHEGLEVGYNLLNNPLWWDSHPPGDYIVAIDTSGADWVWELTPGPEEVINAKYLRKLSISDVCRDPSTGERDTPGCSLDPLTRVVKSTLTVQDSVLPPIMAELLIVRSFVSP